MNDDNIKYGPERPEEQSEGICLGMRVHTVRYDISESGEAPGMAWRWREVTLPPGVWDYDSLVAALVRGRYSDDAMMAIINNHLLDPANAATAAEWAAMQAWRAQAKATARRLLADGV